MTIARQFLGDNVTRSHVLKIILCNGGSEDVDTLMETAIAGFGEDRKLALQGVQKLAADKGSAAKALLASEVREIRRAAIPLIGALPDQGALPFLEDLLSDEDEDLRIAAVEQLRARLDRGQMEDLLRTYTHRGWYFYNVVVWLDRLLYAPAPMSRYYETELEARSRTRN